MCCGRNKKSLNRGVTSIPAPPGVPRHMLTSKSYGPVDMLIPSFDYSPSKREEWILFDYAFAKIARM